MKFLFAVLGVLLFSVASAQQACPVNNNFSLNDLTHWSAYTATFVNSSRTPGTKQNYDTSSSAPNGTTGVSSINEYQLPSVNGIAVQIFPNNDAFGNFPNIPTINGYQYKSSVLLGSTTISRGTGAGGPGGYIRGISYRFNVPTSATSQPYTMTYAYAMVLENGQHNSNNQPWFTATLTTNDSVVTCASPTYFLPTNNDAAGNGGGATLDTAAAVANGFTLSRFASPNSNPNGAQGSAHLYDVWWKGWTEVTFDLSPYRGQQVVLTFEADNCVPGGHFAYAYVALRSTCAGLLISGDTVACQGSVLTYSIPGLNGASYGWEIPGDWSIVSGADSNILKVHVGTQPGFVAAHELNGCANLRDTLQVTTTDPTIPGSLSGGSEICAGSNGAVLTLSGNRGSVLNWISSPDGVNWSVIADTTTQYLPLNLNRTTIYEALVRHGQSCDIDSSTSTKIIVDPKTVGGTLLPADQNVCLEQNMGAVLTLSGNTGSVLNWQSSTDGISWTGVAPVDTDSSFSIVGLGVTTDFRVLVKSGVCPLDSSAIAKAELIPVLFPQAVTEPADTTICYGAIAKLNASISVGTSYAWSNALTLSNQGNGTISGTPFSINAVAAPLKTTDYVLSILNAGCPNPLRDSFDVHVIPPIIVSAGHDTSIVINQPLQLQATSNDPGDVFTWAPPTGLSNPNIANPVAILNTEEDSLRYRVKATAESGCYGIADIVVRVFKSLPDIFVPNAFTPDGTTNNIFRPISPGIASIQYFRVYNRYGQLVFGTTVSGQGWDGRLNGQPLPSGSYVWMVKGTSYTGRPIFKKGVMVLIR